MRSLAAWSALLLSLVLPLVAQRQLLHQPIQVQKKRALVIGNAAYQQAPLKNPVNDAVTVGAALRRLGFEVTVGRDLDLRSMDRFIDEFTGALQNGDLGLFFFAGHGAQVQQENYLIPVDFTTSSEADIKYKAYSASRVRDKMEGSGSRLRILVLDACRNNPFRGARSGAGGLAPMESAAEGTLVAFATGDGNFADDNVGEANGLFTKHLVSTITTPGMSLDEIFRQVRLDVYVASKKKQNPFTYDGIMGRYYFLPPPAGAAGAPAAGAASAVTGDAALQAEIAYWNSIKDEGQPELFEEYLRKYPQGQFVAVARLKLNQPRPAPQGRVAPAAGAAQSSSADSAPSLQELQDRMIFLVARAAAVKSSMQNLERQQNQSGLSMRGDMAAAQKRMEFLIDEANNSLAAKDAGGAKRNMDLAERDLEKLEKFLGR